MAISIKSIGGMMNEPPTVTNLKAIEIDTFFIKIQYTIHDLEMTYCRQYLILNGKKTEITTKGTEIETDTFEYLIEKLNPGTNYNIQIEASDGHDIAKSDNLNVNTLNNFIYGFRVNELNSNSSNCVTYTDDAKGMEDKLATRTSLGGWANKWPFNKIRIVGFKNGKVTKEINPNDKTKYIDGTTVPQDVDVMTEMPKIYWSAKAVTEGSSFDGYEVKISNVKYDDSFDCYAHKVNGAEKDFIYIGCYLGYVQGDWNTGVVRSINNVSPTCWLDNSNRLNFEWARERCQRVGSGYQMFNWFTRILLCNLFLLAYKNINSQDALGRGYVGSNSNNLNYPVTTGGTTKKGIIYGSSNEEQMCFLGIEDLWGNTSQWIDGIEYKGSGVYADLTNTFKNCSTKIANTISSHSSTGYITKVNKTSTSLYLAAYCSGSSNLYYSDYCNIYSSYPHFVSGGYYRQDDQCGLFFQRTHDYSCNMECARLVYLGE